jgi:hypothetical protein
MRGDDHNLCCVLMPMNNDGLVITAAQLHMNRAATNVRTINGSRHRLLTVFNTQLFGFDDCRITQMFSVSGRNRSDASTDLFI